MKTAEQILIKNIKTNPQVTDQEFIDAINSPEHQNILKAMEEYASQFKPQPIKPIIEWFEVKTKYLEHQIDNYDKGYLALFAWLENNYSGIAATPKNEKKYEQCPSCFNSDKNCMVCNGQGILPTN